MLRKLKWQILAARYNWCQGQVPGRGPAVEKHCSRGVIGSMQRPLPDNIQNSHGTDIHTVDGIRYRNPGRQARADPSLGPCAAFTHPPQFTRVSYHNTFKDLKVKCGGLGPVSVVRDSAMLLLLTVRNEKFRGQGVKQWHNILVAFREKWVKIV
jgi:hypothetical protein